MAVVDRMYQCFAAGDMATLKSEVFAGNITWALPGHHPLSGVKRGADEVIAFFAELMRTGINVDNISFGTIGDDRVVENHTGHGTVDGVAYIFPTCSVYTIRDGKIQNVQVYTADQHGVDRYFWAAYQLKPIPERMATYTGPGGGVPTNGSASVTRDLVGKAYAALATGNREQVRQYWADDLVWQVPGQNQLSGWYHNLDEFLGFMKKVGDLSGNSFKMEPITVTVNEDFSADVTRNTGRRAGDDTKILDIEVVHVLRWRKGKIVAGKGAIFGDGTEDYDKFWSRA
jgi:uncharacterized protein